jgi:multiple sugar transport system ATP-binding protein
MNLRDLKKTYGRTEILKGIDLTVASEEFVALVGPSGCGKSTLLRIIAGLEGVTSGSILIDGRDVTHLPPKERDVAMVFQNYALYPHLTVEANMGFSLKLRRKSKALIAEKVQTAAKILELEGLLDRFPGQLSGGQRQRVATGRAIVRDPALFLFDEPLSNLDAKLRVEMRTQIKALHQRLRVTTIYVTHDQIEAMTMADRVVVMRAGEIEQQGAPLDLYDRPANAFVAGFLGSPSMNFLSGCIRNNAFELPDGTQLPLSTAAAAHDGRSVKLGVRPEDIEIGHEGPAAMVEVVEPTGPDTQILARLGGSDVTILLRRRAVVKPGEPVKLSMDSSRIHLFDTESGLRL